MVADYEELSVALPNSARGAKRTVRMRCRERVGMPADYFPAIALATKRGGHAQVKWQQLGTACHFDLPVLVLEQCDEIGTGVARDFFRLDGCAIAEVRGREVHRLRHCV